MFSTIKESWLQHVIVFTLGFTSTLPTLWCPFIFDDTEAIVKNPVVIGLGGNGPEKQFTSAWSHDFWGTELTHPLSHKSYRPLTSMIFRLQFILFGLNPFPFHVLNTLVHCLNCCLVLSFLKSWMHLIADGRKINGQNDIQLLSAILFSIHPVHVEPLGSVVGTCDLLSSLIFLIACNLMSHSRSTPVIMILFLTILGTFFKENAVMSLFAVLFLELLISKERKWSSSQCLKYSFSIIAIIIFISLRLKLQNGAPSFQPYDNPAMFVPDTFLRVLNTMYIWILNGYILFNPYWLCFDWSMGCIPVISSIKDIRLIAVCVAALIGLKLVSSAVNSRLIATCLVISGVTFLPASNIIFTVGFVLAERNLYLPSIGYCLFAAHVLSVALSRRKMFEYMKILLLILFFAKSVHRSFQWLDPESLFAAGLKVCPLNAKIHYNMGRLKGDQLMTEEAVKYYSKALELKPDYYQAMNNIGNIYREKNHMQKAEYWLRKAIKTKGDFASAWMNLGIILSKQNVSEAVSCYKKALSIRKNYADCEYNLGNLYHEMGLYQEAIQLWEHVVHVKPKHFQAWTNLIILLDELDRHHEAKKFSLMAIEAMPSKDIFYFLLGNVYGKLSEFQKAESSFKTAIMICQSRQDPVPNKYYSNLGVLYHRNNNLDLAEEYYTISLKLNPKSKNVKKNLQKVQALRIRH